MKRWLLTSSALATGALLTAGLAFGESKEECTKRTQTPEKVEGQVVAVDQNAGKVTIRDFKGTTHEFQANRETLQEMKPGEKIEAKLREAPKC
jgi:Cu/Ag efflux protein CusF